MRAVLCALLAALAMRSAERPPALFCRHELCQYTGRDIMGRPQYRVNDSFVTIVYKNGHLWVDCERASVLNSSALPRAEPALVVSRVELYVCPLPAAGSLADTLAALNVVLEHSKLDEPGPPRGNLTLWFLPSEPPFAASHFTGLEHLVHLNIFGTEKSRSSPDFLMPLVGLRSLEMWDVLLPTGEIEIPPSLRKFHLNEGSMKQLPEGLSLEWLRVVGWKAPRPTPLARCEKLRELYLVRPVVETLPDGWLANCFCLELIEIDMANHLTTLSPKLLIGANTLMSLAFKRGVLETLPAELLEYSPKLRSLLLQNNRLRTFTSDMFKKARRVQELDLSSNELETSTMDALAPLENLTILNLAFNSRLSDVCKTDGYSPLRYSKKLRKLFLIGTNVTRICRDWREDLTVLETLDLRFTNMSELLYEDLHFTRTVEATVVLPDALVTAVKMTREDYIDAIRGLSTGVSLLFNTSLDCDCSVYWTRRAVDFPALKYLGKLRCADDRLLRDVPSDDMVCARPEECEAAALPPACACDVRPDDDPVQDRLLVRAHCERAALTHVPHPRAINDSTKRVYELLLAHNDITNLNIDDLHSNIKGLDLTDNSLQTVDEETAKSFGDMKGMLRLARNPLECSCRTIPLLRALHSRNDTQFDLSNVTCSDGSALYSAFTMNCSPVAALLGIWLVSGLATLLAFTLVVKACLASRERRFFILAVLHRWGFVWRTDDPTEDDNRRYDAFMTFSHKDRALVPEMIARLEPTYRLCVHYRDWIPGHFISEQVVESVRESRRTIALVSRHFLASSWARAEFREAHAAAMLDARPRLIVVLLEEPAALEMDEQLRRYVATHTYLRWGEPWFWDKLAVALPRPRAPRTGPATPGAPLALALMSAPPRAATVIDAPAL